MFEQFTSSTDELEEQTTADMLASTLTLPCCLFTLLLKAVCEGTGAGLQLCDPDHTPNEESTYLLQSNIPDVADTSDNYGQSTYLLGDRGCPQHNRTTPHTCPTYFSLNFDPNREPPTIAEVICACANCRYETGESRNACVPVYYYRNVLVRGAGGRCYMWRVRAFRVGCQCMGARTDGMSFTQTQE